ncbi:MAG: TIGR02300 family protein [Geminicoccaceae bacterium]|nr:MAG: TIGR02300 family protein [Geminicoccaceae bacterium]
MVKPEWGTKRICQSCGARFYDFQRSPIICPACGATFELEALTRSRRGRAVPRAAAVAAVEPAVADEDDLEKLEVDEEADADFESADELGEDGDVGDVIAPGTDDDDENR